MDSIYNMHDVVERGIEIGNRDLNLDRDGFSFRKWVPSKAEWAETVKVWEGCDIPHEVRRHAGYVFIIQTDGVRRGAAFTHQVIADPVPVKAASPESEVVNPKRESCIRRFIDFLKGD